MALLQYKCFRHNSSVKDSCTMTTTVASNKNERRRKEQESQANDINYTCFLTLVERRFGVPGDDDEPLPSWGDVEVCA